MKKAVIAFLAVLLVAILGWAYYFLLKTPSADIALEFEKPDEVFVGQPFEIAVGFANYSDYQVENAKLALALPSGMSFVGEDEDQRVKETEIGALAPGSMKREAFRVIVIAGAESVKHVTARLNYAIAGISGSYVSESEADLAVGRSSADLAVTVPEKVFSGESFDVTVKYANNSDGDLRGVRLALDLPDAFKFEKSSAPPAGQNIWDLGTLNKGESGTLTVRGSVTGPENSFVNLNGTLTADHGGTAYTIAAQTVNVGIALSPLSVTVMPNENPAYVAHPGDTVTYTVRFRNNSRNAFENLNVRAALTGELFDYSTARSDGSFNSLQNAFSWNPASNPELSSLGPGAEESVDFTIRLKEAYPIRRLSDKNFMLKVDVQVESPTVPEGTTAAKTVSLARIETKVGGRLEVAAKALFRDAQSGILNSGPYPPRVNRPTQYTVHWIVKNYATDAAGIRVSASLLSGAKFTGKVKSTIDAQPTFNPASGEVVWEIPALPATKGVIGQPIEAIFQIEQTPAVNQVGRAVPLVSITTLRATDSFTSQTLTASAPDISTDLPDDPNLTSGNRHVQP